MARVTYHGESFDVPDSNTLLLDYYRGEGAEVVPDGDGLVFENNWYEPGHAVPDADPGTGEPVEQPGDTPDPAGA